VQFRLILTLYSSALAIVAIWLLCAELTSPDITSFPIKQETAFTAANHRNDALLAARFGWARGDLWSEAAFSYANLMWVDEPTVEAPVRGQAKAVAEKAARLSPVNPALWLMLADFASRFGWQKPIAAESLKISYYTGPHEPIIIPLRLAVAAQLDPSVDHELELLFAREVENVLTYHPELRSAIRSAYRQATSGSRQIIEEVAGRLDPAFSRSLPSSADR
jgi:hypothetical protein